MSARRDNSNSIFQISGHDVVEITAELSQEAICVRGCPIARSPPISGLYVSGCPVHDIPQNDGSAQTLTTGLGTPTIVQTPLYTVIILLGETSVTGTTVLRTPPGTIVLLSPHSVRTTPTTPVTPPGSPAIDHGTPVSFATPTTPSSPAGSSAIDHSTPVGFPTPTTLSVGSPDAPHTPANPTARPRGPTARPTALQTPQTPCPTCPDTPCILPCLFFSTSVPTSDDEEDIPRLLEYASAQLSIPGSDDEADDDLVEYRVFLMAAEQAAAEEAAAEEYVLAAEGQEREWIKQGELLADEEAAEEAQNAQVIAEWQLAYHRQRHHGFRGYYSPDSPWSIRGQFASLGESLDDYSEH